MKSLFGGSTGLGLALLTASLLVYSSPLAAETSSSSVKPQPTPVQNEEEALNKASVPLPAEGAKLNGSSTLSSEGMVKPEATAPVTPAAPPVAYVATAYSLRGRGASGMGVRKGTIAADPRVLPFGTRVRLDAGPYSGEYLVTDSGSAVKGNKIDVWVPTNKEACRFGRRTVKLTVLSYGARRGAKARKPTATAKNN
jgi:3D (Asp-Asp-Asp) domain-containing protein